MGNNAEREKVKSAYKDSQSWARRVDRMSDSQVVAIYMRLKAAGKI